MSPRFALLAQVGFDGHMGGWGWLVIVAMIAMMGGMGWMMLSMMRGPDSRGRGSSEDPVDVLKARYARGDITTEEFQERLRTIENAQM